jgi:hypothetical protein
MRLRNLLLPVLLAAVVLTGCGGGGSDEPDASGPTFTVSTTTPSMSTETTVRSLSADEIDTSASPYCATWAEIRGAGGPKTQGLDEAAAAERRKTYYGQLLPTVERLLEQAPDEIEDAVQAARDQTQESATTGSFDPFRTPAAKQVAARLAQYALDHCAKG